MFTEDLILNVARHITIDDDERNYFISLFTVKKFGKREFILKEGEPCLTFNYVNNGALRAFYRDEKDKEATIMFAVKDWWITDMPSFVNQKPALINIEAISKCEVLQITKSNLDGLLNTFPKFEKFLRILMQNAYVREQLRTLQNLSVPAEVRYNNFLKKYPDIVQQVPLKNIASYLGVTPEFLSAIRKAKKH